MSAPEFVLRTVALLVMLALAGLMLASRRRDHTAVAGALFVMAVAAFIVTSGVDAASWLGVWIYPLTALCVAKAAFFWVFGHGLFDEEFRLQPKHGAVVGVTIVYGAWQQLVFDGRMRLGLAGAWERAAAAGFETWVLVLILLALAGAYRGLRGDLVERRRRLRIVFVAGISAYLATAVFVQGYNLILHAETPASMVLANLALITIAGLSAIWNLLELRTAGWLHPEPVGSRLKELSALERHVLAALVEHLEKRRIYRQEGLTIAALAGRLGTREHILRRVINRGLGYRNFNDFLHAYRIREACDRLRQAQDARLPVLSIALSVGYGSIGPFNRAFKARTGMTPTRFRRNGSAAGPT